MTTARCLDCQKCGKGYVYHPSWSIGPKPKNWGKCSRKLCPDCYKEEYRDEGHERRPKTKSTEALFVHEPGKVKPLKRPNTKIFFIGNQPLEDEDEGQTPEADQG